MFTVRIRELCSGAAGVENFWRRDVGKNQVSTETIIFDARNRRRMLFLSSRRRKDAEVTMDGQFLVRQIYDDEITYNLVSSAAQILSEHYRFKYNISIY